MARPREFDEDQVLEAAMEAFWDRGYESLTIDDLVAATGLSRSSIYQAFGNKRGLFDAAVNFYVDRRLAMMLGGLEADDADFETVVDFFSMLDEVSRDYPDRFALGCLVTNTMTELGRSDSTVRNVGTDYVRRLRAAFVNAIASSAPSPQDADARAEVLSMLALGAFVRARGAEPDPNASSLAALVENTMASWSSSR